ncbi:hypothetical protein NMG60_11004069 [Bertholletia excelsa]
MGRNPCCSKEAGLNRGAWSLQEDEILINYLRTHGVGKWRTVPQGAGLKRCGKSCRLRWLNYLRPDIKRGDISADEEDLIIRLHNLLGNRWALIAGRLPGRTDNEIKNYWNTCLAKKLHGRAYQKLPNKLLKAENEPVRQNPEQKTPQLAQNEPSSCSKTSYPKEDNNVIAQNDNSLIVEGEGPTPSSSSALHDDHEDLLEFLMGIDIGDVLVPDILQSDFADSQSGAMAGPKSDAMASGGPAVSPSFHGEVASEMKGGPLRFTLDSALKRVASFLDLEDEWNEH